jgi:hypothetical protein
MQTTVNCKFQSTTLDNRVYAICEHLQNEPKFGMFEKISVDEVLERSRIADSTLI